MSRRHPSYLRRSIQNSAMRSSEALRRPKQLDPLKALKEAVNVTKLHFPSENQGLNCLQQVLEDLANPSPVNQQTSEAIKLTLARMMGDPDSQAKCNGKSLALVPATVA